MAKRYYDLSLETSSDAYFPVHLSLLSLYTRSLYHYFFVSGSPNSPTPLELFPTSPPKLPLLKPIIPPVKENWNPRRVWNEIQKKWNFQPMELPIENREDRQRAIEVEGTLEVPIDWRTRDREEDEDYFDFDAGEGTDYSTLAIIALCIILA